MHPEYKMFLNLFRRVNYFTPDNLLTDIREDGFLIDKKMFLDHLYVERDVEQIIKKQIELYVDNLLCIVGPKGAGKSSICLKIINDYNNDIAENIFIIPINMRQDYGGKSFDDLYELRKFLRDKIKNFYRSEFPINKKSDNSFSKSDLYAYILDVSIPDYERPKDYFIDFQEDIDIILYYYEYDKVGKSNYKIKDWLIEKIPYEEKIFGLIQKIDDKIDIVHYAYALKYFYEYDKQIIWIDNIDILPDIKQSQLVRAINVIQDNLSTFVNFIIAVREENIYRIDEFEDDSAPPFQSIVYLENPNKDHSASELNSINFPVISSEKIELLAQKRFLFTKYYQKYLQNKINSNIDLNKGKLSNPKLSQSGIKIIEKTITYWENKLETYCSPTISDAKYELLKKILIKYLNIFEQEKIIYLSNNSIRIYLPLLADIINHSLKRDTEKIDEPTVTKLPNWFLTTELLTYISDTQHYNSIELFDVFHYTFVQSFQNKDQILCFLPHLCLTTIWNLLLNRKKKVGDKVNTLISPTIKEVKDKLIFLGYDESEISESLFHLYLHGKGRGNFIELRTKENINKVTQLDDEYLVRITYRGKCTIGLICNSFGYLYDCYLRLRRDKKLSIYLNPEDTFQHSVQLLPYLCDLAQAHYNSLKKIREIKYKNDSNWFDKYLFDYGIPQVPPYIRKDPIGKQLSGRRRALYFESIMYSLNAYFSYDPYVQTNYSILYKEYMRAIRTLENYSDTIENQPEFRNLFK